MLTLDAQVHAYERDHPGRPWAGALTGPSEVTGDDMVAAMDAVGVDGAILVSPFSLYRYDAGYAVEVHAAYPGRFGLVTPVDPSDPAVGEKIAEWARKDGTVGIRLLHYSMPAEAGNAGIKRVLDAAARHSLVVNIFGWQRLDQIGVLAAGNPNTRIVIDHLGLEPHFKPPLPVAPFAQVPNVVKLAAYDNVAIKITGACALSHRPFPYGDIWDHLRRIFDAFGFARCMWGTDWTRAINFLTYRQGVDAFRVYDGFTDDERALLMGESLARIYDWSPQKT
jgi:predicted TIM-barrel fold metal-dependent hydrolase